MKTKKEKSLTCTGAGLVALDIVVNGKTDHFKTRYAGGSCGNVLTILSFMGWHSYPIARLSEDEYADYLTDDLEKWNVKTHLVEKTIDGRTPLIIHRITTNKKGEPKHRFEFRWPDTGEWLPNYKAVLSRKVDEIKKQTPKANVFYFDRINRASVELAKHHRINGSTIVFEPSSYKESNLFKECLDVSHIIKYSSERLNKYSEILSDSIVPLVIETLGNNGLRYRLRKSKNIKWKYLRSFSFITLKDAAGSGDWCTAGLLNYLGNNIFDALSEKNCNEIEKALNFGQILASLNSHFEGARGLMYGMENRKLKRCLNDISDNVYDISKQENSEIKNYIKQFITIQEPI